MHIPESNGDTDYIYYPIEYTSNALTTLLTYSIFPYEGTEFCTWIKPIDKAKFISGAGANNYSYIKDNVFNVISVGF